MLHALVYFRLDDLILRTRLSSQEPLSSPVHYPSDTVLELQTHIDAVSSYKITALMLAVMFSSLSTAKTLLALGANADAMDANGETALHIASRGTSPNDLELVKCLMPKTLDITAKNKKGYAPFLLVINKDIAETFIDNNVYVDSVREIDNMTLLGLAAMEGNAELVTVLLRRGADKNHRSDREWTPLLAAASNGDAETIRLLLDQSVEIHAEVYEGCNPLHAVAEKGSSEAVQLLLDYGIDKNSVTTNSRTALFIAAERGNEEAVEALLRAGTNIELRNDKGYTPLHIAAFEGRDTIIQKLIDQNANVNSVAKDNSTPLVSASSCNHLSTARLLVKSGADTTFTHPSTAPMLQWAIYNSYLELAEFLIQAGADIHSMAGSSYTSLYVAARKNHPRIAKILMENGANTQYYDENGMSALHYWASHGRQELVRHFLDNVSVNVKPNYKRIPLHFAAREGHLTNVKQLFTAKSEINAPTSGGYTPLNYASTNGRVDVVKYLLAKGADPSLCANDGWGPLEGAAANGNYEIVRALLEAGASTKVRTNLGMTALYIAAYHGHVEIVKRLLEAGADRDECVGLDTWTPLFAAAENGHFEVVNELLDAEANSAHLSKQGTSLLHVVAQVKTTDTTKRALQITIAKLLLQSNGDIHATTKNGTNMLICASLGGNLEFVDLLLNHGADVTHQNKFGRTAMHAAAEEGYLHIVSRLLKAGADVNVLDVDRWNALMHAARWGHTEVVRRLLQAQTDPSHCSDLFDTALHCATRYYWKSTMEVLLASGANPWVVDSYGKSAVEWAYLHEPMYQVMKTQHFFFQATDEAKTTSRLQLCVHLLTQRIISAPRENDHHLNQLGHLLLRLNKVDDACVAYELIIRVTEPVQHHVTCDSCNYERVKGKRFVCKTCSDMDLCNECMVKYKDCVGIRGCIGHEFLEIPRPGWGKFPPEGVNNEGESIHQWLDRIYKAYKDSPISAEEANVIGYEGSVIN